MTVAGLAPERVRRLVLAAPVNPWSAHGKQLASFLSNPFIAPLFLLLAPHLRVLHDFYFRRLFGETRRIRPGTLEGYMAPLRRPEVLKHKLNLLRTWKHDLEELEAIIARIADIPTLLIWGSEDAAVSTASAPELKKRFRRSRLIMLEGVGHLPYEETPSDFNRVVAEFLQGAHCVMPPNHNFR
jgi:pimeloyl-ACP methyl ester carboxylesterase